MTPTCAFTSLRLENFKQTGAREIRLDRVSVVEGGAGLARSQVLDAMWLLRSIAEGRDTSAAPAAWFGADWPTAISVTFNTQKDGELRYSVMLQRIGEERVRVTDERLESASGTLLLRHRHSYSLDATCGRYGIGSQEFALHNATSLLDGADSAHELVKWLRNIWVLNPNPSAMRGLIGHSTVNAGDAGFANLATCIVMQQLKPEVVSAMTETVCSLSPEVRRYSVERNEEGRPYLAVYRSSDLDGKGTSFGNLENAEKMSFLMAFVCAMNEHSEPMPVAWDSPLNWFGARERENVSKLLRRSFSRRGQLVMLA